MAVAVGNLQQGQEIEAATISGNKVHSSFGFRFGFAYTGIYDCDSKRESLSCWVSFVTKYLLFILDYENYYFKH